MWFSSVVLCIALICLVFMAWLKGKMKTQAQLPPGPPPLPLLGNLLQIRTGELLASLQKFREEYGPVFTVHFGSRPVVMLCGYNAIKEALVDQKHAFSGRGKMPINDYVMKGYGITASNGERWKQMRRFTLTTLRNFGVGKRSIEERIQEEAQFLLEEFQKTGGKPFDPTFFLSCAVSNIICSVVFGNRFEFSDQRFLSLLRNINGIIRYMASAWNLVLYNFPQLFRHIPGPHQRILKHISELKTFVHERVEESKESLDPLSPRHFIDCFLIKMQQDMMNPDTEFHMENLVASTVNLFFAGTETVSTTLRYGFLILLKYPEIQAKVQNEIDQAIGHQYPSVNDRARMPYTEAVIHEIQRFGDIIPTGLPHTTTEDVQFQNYLIPKGTDVFPLLTSSLKDPEHFPNPEVFLPERFLDNQGNVKKNPALLPFSAGRRICPGEGLARTEIFLFVTTILQKFTLTTSVSQEELDLSPEISSSGHLPRSYKIRAVPRTRNVPSSIPS